jgi:short-subunit dehydrogenase
MVQQGRAPIIQHYSVSRFYFPHETRTFAITNKKKNFFIMQHKIVMITGASSGIGKALVYECARQGAKIAMAARNVDELLRIEQDLRGQGVELLSVQTDVTREADCRAFVEQTYRKFGRIDILINNAGISMRALFEEVDLDVMRRLMDVNFWGTVYCTKYALPYLLDVHGSVTGVISVAGFIGLPGRTGYAASKFAVRGFLNTLRIENRKRGLHVLVAAPGFTASNIRKSALAADGSQQGETPRAEDKMMSAERCARIIARAIRKRKREIVMTFVEGKISLFLSKWWPRLLDRLAYSHMAKEPNSPFK